MKSNLAMIKKEADIFGLLFLGDGATFLLCPLLNILASAKNIPVAVLGNVDCHVHLADGNKKDGTFICNRFFGTINFSHMIQKSITNECYVFLLP